MDQTPIPRLDARSIEIDAPPERVWDALVQEPPADGRLQRLGAALLGCRERRAHGPPGERGSTLVGFRVEEAIPPSRLALTGAHRFSTYALTFDIEPASGGGARLTATTDAVFFAPYRALVVGTGMHARLTDRMLARIRRRATG